MKIDLGVEMDPRDGKSSSERCHFGLSREVMNVTYCRSICQHFDKLYRPLDQSGVAVAGATKRREHETEYK